MSKNTQQVSAQTATWQSLRSSIKHAAAFLSGHSVLAELSSAAAHYNGLIDSIERAGWDVSRLEQIKHPFDTLVQELLDEVVESYPALSKSERQALLAPYQQALYQFSHMNPKEKQEFRGEYARFTQLQAESLRLFATDQSPSDNTSLAV